MYQNLLWISLLVLGLQACNKDTDPLDVGQEPEPVGIPTPDLPETPFNYADHTLPAGFSQGLLQLLDNDDPDNPITNEGATLGRVLFYDPNLSNDNTVACASCHLQEYAFSDPNALSNGINGNTTARHSMPLFNLRYSRRMFWDGRTGTLENQALIPIQDPHEMGMDLNELLVRLDTLDYYPPLFEQAFGKAEITEEGIARAIGQFIRSMYSYQSKYDAGLLNDFADFSAQERMGKDLFFSGEFGCNFCHTEITFTSTGFFNNGLDAEYSDQGRGAVTGNPADNGKFKTPSLRNIALTAPYMHDARFQTLEEVVEHYNSGVQAHPNLDDRMSIDGETGGPPKKLNMTETEKAAIIAFLLTLTDEVLLTDEKFSDPFKS